MALFFPLDLILSIQASSRAFLKLPGCLCRLCTAGSAQKRLSEAFQSRSPEGPRPIIPVKYRCCAWSSMQQSVERTDLSVLRSHFKVPKTLVPNSNTGVPVSETLIPMMDIKAPVKITIVPPLDPCRTGRKSPGPLY